VKNPYLTCQTESVCNSVKSMYCVCVLINYTVIGPRIMTFNSFWPLTYSGQLKIIWYIVF